MPKEASFYFVPLKKAKSGREKNDFEPYVRIQKGGRVYLSQRTLQHFDVMKGSTFYLGVYSDPSKRALAFKFLKVANLTELKDESVRVVKTSAMRENYAAFFSAKEFLRQCGEVTLPTKRLPIKKYKDALMGDLLYVKVPRKGETEKENTEVA